MVLTYGVKQGARSIPAHLAGNMHYTTLIMLKGSLRAMLQPTQIHYHSVLLFLSRQPQACNSGWEDTLPTSNQMTNAYLSRIDPP